MALAGRGGEQMDYLKGKEEEREKPHRTPKLGGALPMSGCPLQVLTTPASL